MATSWNTFSVVADSASGSWKVRLSSDRLTALAAESPASALEPGDFFFDPSKGTLVASKIELIDDNSCESLDDIRYLGEQMWLALAAGQTGETWTRVRRSYRKGERIPLGLHLEDERLQGFPWEALFARATGDFALAANEGFCIARMPPSGANFQLPLPDEDIHVLIIAPKYTGLNVNREISAIERVLGARGVQPTVIHEATPDGIAAVLSKHKVWSIVHFIGHGRLNKTSGQSEILLNDSGGGETWFDATVFANLFATIDARLVVLNCCEGNGSSDRIDTLNGLGVLLMFKGVPAVVAMQYAVHDRIALLFADTFYHALFAGEEGGRVDAAMTAARSAIYRNQGVDLRAYITPVLHLAPGYERICRLDAPPGEPSKKEPEQPKVRVSATGVVLPENLIEALKKGRCVPVIGPGILQLGRMRDQRPRPPSPFCLTERLANGRPGRPYPCNDDIDLCRRAEEWLSPLVQQRVCEHYWIDGSDGYNKLIEIVTAACRATKADPMIERLARWEVPAMFYTYFDGLLDNLQRRRTSSFTQVITQLTAAPAVGERGAGHERLLVLVRGSALDDNTMVLTERDHEKLHEQILGMHRQLIDVARQPGTSVVFLGLSPRDAVAHLLAQKLVDTTSDKRRQGTTYFACPNPSEVDQAYWDRYQVKWLKDDLELLLPAMMDIQPEVAS